MNQRLKKIMLESGTHKYISADCQHRIEQIADLIVQECIDVINEAVDHREPASTYADKIRQHFELK